MAAAGHHPAALRLHTFGPGAHVPGAIGTGLRLPHSPGPLSHSGRARRRDGHLLVAADSFFVHRPAHAGAGSGSHVLRPFPLAEAPNEIKDLLRRGGGKGTG